MDFILVAGVIIFICDRILRLYFLKTNYAFINRGVSFGTFDSLNLFFHIFIFALFVILLFVYAFMQDIQNDSEFYSKKHKHLFTFFRKDSRSYFLFLFILFSFSNLLDRIVYGGVVDYINFFGLFWNNLSDILIFSGILIFVVRTV